MHHVVRGVLALPPMPAERVGALLRSAAEDLDQVLTAIAGTAARVSRALPESDVDQHRCMLLVAACCTARLYFTSVFDLLDTDEEHHADAST